jgi:hypothetical protein
MPHSACLRYKEHKTEGACTLQISWRGNGLRRYERCRVPLTLVAFPHWNQVWANHNRETCTNSATYSSKAAGVMDMLQVFESYKLVEKIPTRRRHRVVDEFYGNP